MKTLFILIIYVCHVAAQGGRHNKKCDDGDKEKCDEETTLALITIGSIFGACCVMLCICNCIRDIYVRARHDLVAHPRTIQNTYLPKLKEPVIEVNIEIIDKPVLYINPPTYSTYC